MAPETETKTVTNGAAWAAFLACGIGCATFGLLTDLAEGTRFFAGALNWYKPSGNLSGKTGLAIGVWLIAWVVLHARWKNRNIDRPGKIAAVTLILVLLSFLATFPPVFELLK